MPVGLKMITGVFEFGRTLVYKREGYDLLKIDNNQENAKEAQIRN